MFEIVNEILEGNYMHENGSLDFSCTKIELSLMQGEKGEGSFRIVADQGSMVSGRVLSTDYRMEVPQQDFTSADSEISYIFHGEGLEEGETAKGAFRVISNLGEYSIPFVVTCEHQIPDSSMGAIKNLFHFTNLAKSNWQEALQLFYSDDFLKVLSGVDSQYQTVYRGLSSNPFWEQNMEEFLIHVGKKQPMEFRAEPGNISLELMPGDGEYQLTEQEITVVRNGWGYTALNLECDGAFLFTEKEVLGEDDFIGNYARVPVYIDRTYLRQGLNSGKIVFYNSFLCFEVEVRVRLGMEHLGNQTDLAKKKCIASLMTEYEGFRTKRISLNAWLKETGRLLEKLISLDESDPVSRLLKAQLLITQERNNEADWLLSYAKELMDEQGSVNDETWAYYLYLTSLLTREEGQADLVAEEVEQLYRKNPESWRIAWLLLYLSEEYMNSPEKKFRLLERQFERGCCSVVLYLEAVQILQGNSALLRKLEDFEQQVLYYGFRKDLFGQETAERFLDLLEKRKEYSVILCKILEILYEKRQDARIVQAMCSLLLKGGVTGERALPWYEKGVEQQLRLTNLYEAFMASVNPASQKGLPKAAVLYFVYQSKMDYERRAFLYDHVLDNKVLYADVYEKYLAKAKEFVAEQIGKERIDRHLANLYAKLVTPDMITEQNVQAFTRIVFSTRIHVEDSRFKKAIVYHPGYCLGREYVLSDGETVAPIFGNESAILFEDAFGNRFAAGDVVELEKYMLFGKFVQELMKYDQQCPEFDLYLIREKAAGDSLGDDLAQRVLRLCMDDMVEEELKKHLCLMLLRLFYEKGQEKEFSQILSALPDAKLSLEERREVARYLVLNEQYDMAFEWVRIYGPYFLDANTLARLLSNVIGEDTGYDQALTAAGTYLFRRGKASAAVLGYLDRWAEGNSKELRDLWKKMKSSQTQTAQLEERLLVQLMYTGSYVGERADIFTSHYQTVGMDSVMSAFVMQSAYEYFVRERVTEEVLIRTILEEYLQGKPVQTVCKLAYLKYYADNEAEITRDVNMALDAFLQEMMREKIHFAFYRKLKDQRPLLGEMADRVIVEYRTRPGGHARIHYVILQENGEEQEYLAESMRDVFGGICCKEFVLFFGETLQYYVTEEVNGEETLTESGNLQCPDLEADAAGGKFGLVNDIVISKSLQDYDTLDKGLTTYYFREFCGEALFELE